MKKSVPVLMLFIFSGSFCFSQTQHSENVYPKTVGYASFVHPIVTFNKNGSTFNFSNSYIVGFPMGINILKSDKIGFSFELTPFIKAQDGTSKVNNLLFHPGIMFRYKHGFTIITRMAFETSGRYGLTAVFNKVVIREKHVNYFIAASVPCRTGNNLPSSVGIALQMGVSF